MPWYQPSQEHLGFLGLRLLQSKHDWTFQPDSGASPSNTRLPAVPVKLHVSENSLSIPSSFL